MGRYEEALEAGDAAIAIARRLGRSDSVVMNYSTMPLRDIFWLDEAHERSEEVAERLGPSEFNMPWLNARADLICAELLLGDIGAVEGTWASAWDDAAASHAWERWLIGGRLASVRADVEFERGRFDDALTWAGRAVEMARTGRRRKYETLARLTLGRILMAQGSHEDAMRELQRAAALADSLGTPLLRWQVLAALGEAERHDRGTADRGEARIHEAESIIRGIAASLAPVRAERYLSARQVIQVLDAAG
jgi:tetratricopeptide (TPR) repeat protein